MDKHFKLRKDLTTTINGKTLYRVEATKDIVHHDVMAGEIGGFVESAENLTGDAWVAGNARVFDNAMVSGNAMVTGNARVFGNAKVSGNAWVHGDAKVSGNALVCGNARVHDEAWVRDDARVFDNADIFEHAQIYGSAAVCGKAIVYGNAWVSTDILDASDSWIHVDGVRYFITILPNFIQLTDHLHRKEEWWGFSDVEILDILGKDGLKWWKKWKPSLQAMSELIK